MLRKEIEPQIELAEKLYPQVLSMLEAYTELIDENGDEDMTEYKLLEDKLHAMTGKDMSQYNLWEWWEEEGIEVLAFRICLPDPKKVDNVTKDELQEILARISNAYKTPDENDESFMAEFGYYLSDYYHEFLELNIKKYSYDLFCRNKDKDGNYFEYSNEEILEKLI